MSDALLLLLQVHVLHISDAIAEKLRAQMLELLDGVRGEKSHPGWTSTLDVGCDRNGGSGFQRGSGRVGFSGRRKDGRNCPWRLRRRKLRGDELGRRVS